jgi:hypothetical protein
MCLPERQDYDNRWSLIDTIKSCLSGSIARSLVRRSLTCGYENGAFQAGEKKATE